LTVTCIAIRGEEGVSQTANDPFDSITAKLKLDDKEKDAAAELILLNPELLLGQYKNSDALSKEAEGLTENRNLVVAENRFATALKLALYEGDAAKAKKYLARCLKLDQANHTVYKTVMDNFDTLSKCVLEFYRAKSGTA
jgi:hypothetical protein